MSKTCMICGKGKTFGNSRSHSNRQTNKPVDANLQKQSVEINGKVTTGYICANCIKTMKKTTNK